MNLREAILSYKIKKYTSKFFVLLIFSICYAISNDALPAMPCQVFKFPERRLEDLSGIFAKTNRSFVLIPNELVRSSLTLTDM